MKYADDIAKDALGRGLCPDCGATIVDLRGTSASQFTLRDQGRCCSDGQSYECNKEARDKKAGSAWK